MCHSSESRMKSKWAQVFWALGNHFMREQQPCTTKWKETNSMFWLDDIPLCLLQEDHGLGWPDENVSSHTWKDGDPNSPWNSLKLHKEFHGVPAFAKAGAAFDTALSEHHHRGITTDLLVKVPGPDGFILRLSHRVVENFLFKLHTAFQWSQVVESNRGKLSLYSPGTSKKYIASNHILRSSNPFHMEFPTGQQYLNYPQSLATPDSAKWRSIKCFVIFIQVSFSGMSMDVMLPVTSSNSIYFLNAVFSSTHSMCHDCYMWLWIRYTHPNPLRASFWQRHERPNLTQQNILRVLPPKQLLELYIEGCESYNLHVWRQFHLRVSWFTQHAEWAITEVLSVMHSAGAATSMVNLALDRKPTQNPVHDPPHGNGLFWHLKFSTAKVIS